MSFGQEVVNEGDYGQLFCSIIRGDPPFSFTWSLQGDTVHTEPGLTTNQIGGVSNPSSRYGPTRAPADGVNTEVREGMQKRTDEWNVFWPARPIRDTPNNCGKCSEFGLNFRRPNTVTY